MTTSTTTTTRTVIIPEGPEVHPSSSTFCGPCPAWLRGATVRGEGPARDGGLCYCSSRRMPLVTDLEYDAFVRAQGARGQQVLVVCVSGPGGHLGALEQLYERTSGNRTMPCCQMDPFRLVRYEVSAGRKTGSARRRLLQLRHNVAPGMLLMYIGGELLFADHISASSTRCSVRDLYQQISTTRRAFRLGLQGLPADYKSGYDHQPGIVA
ncbi:hypothetical protein CRUP_016678 [Coryphaenoides rupestris]|nr:hypothetical protein CRUP_016678 [Coryphaenoides rupestris]